MQKQDKTIKKLLLFVFGSLFGILSGYYLLAMVLFPVMLMLTFASDSGNTTVSLIASIVGVISMILSLIILIGVPVLLYRSIYGKKMKKFAAESQNNPDDEIPAA